jgi:hypothetical protein
MDVFLYIGVPFGILLVPFVWAAMGIGGSASDPNQTPPSPPTIRLRLRRTTIILGAALITGLGAAAAASAGAFARTTDVGYPIEPTALLFALEALVDIALIAVVALPGWSGRRAWLLRMLGIYWLCAAAPILILADAGPGWLSTDPATGLMMAGIPAFSWELLAAFAPAVLLLIASRNGRSPAAPDGDVAVTSTPGAGTL